MKSFVLGVFALLVSACSGSNTDQLLLNQIRALVDTAQQGDSVLQLRKIDSVKWDQMVLIRPYTGYETLDKELTSNKKVLATKIDQRDDVTVMVFTNAGVVVGVVEFSRAVSDLSQLELRRYKPEDSIFLSIR
ncbi:hypothetical protein [Limnobacter sp.]|uniref:hypothetical protein n=1 Tax=Limnobacter sp. TaxID=2003368 RepID=UPI002FE165B5